MAPPRIRIKFGRFLEREFSKNLSEPYVKPGDELVQLIESYKKEWENYEALLLRAMQEVFGIEFYSNDIPVYIVNASSASCSFSDPLTIRARHRPQEFVDVLTHELLHVLLTNNTRELDVKKIWKEMFPTIEDQKALNHIVLHAAHSLIYKDYLNDLARLERNITQDQKFPSYKQAWDIVEEEGDINIVSRFKSYYV